MSERGDALLDAISESLYEWADGDVGSPSVIRAICEHLGITWADVDSAKMAAAILGSDYSGRYSLEGGVTSPSKLEKMADALATLLEAPEGEREPSV